MELPTSSSLRFLVRQSPSSSTTPSNPNSQKPSSLRLSSLSHSSSLLTSSSSSSSSSQSQSPSPEGVVVIGFIGRRSDDTSQLINRILDSNVFGSGNLDRDLASGFHKLQLEEEETGPRLRRHPRIGYYYEEEKGIVFLQFEPSFSPSTSLCSITDGSSSSAADGKEVCLYSVLEEQDSEDLLGMLVMFSVTPPFPIVLATSPVVQFEASCLPPSVPDCERQSQFSLGYRVILPPESFLTFRLPFVYGVQLADKSLHPLNHFEHQPELTAWITKGTTLQVISMGNNINEEFHM